MIKTRPNLRLGWRQVEYLLLVGAKISRRGPHLARTEVFTKKNKYMKRNANTFETEFKHMYTSAPVSVVSKLPRQIRNAIENSALWKWERDQGLQVTGCLATLFPKSNQQDVSFTIWCGNEDGYHINEVFGLQLDISS
jgi:hypothetical protein